MTTVAESKTPERNRLEGFVLNAVFVGVPTYAGVVLTLKLCGAHEAIAEGWGAAVFVPLASFFHALIAPSLWNGFPRFVKRGHEPLFYDARLSFSEKFRQWHSLPEVSAHLAKTVIVLTVLAIAVVSFR
jgi:hypothetical protein